MSPDRNSLTDASPWLSYEAIDFLSRHLRSDMKLFEYGSGGSTLFFAKIVGEIVSVEHDKNWFLMVKGFLDQLKQSNVEYILAVPEQDETYSKKDISNPSHYISEDKNFSGMNFENYAKQIEKYNDDYFDCVVIDGRARPSCLSHSISKLKSNGVLIFDNCESEHYGNVIQKLLSDNFNVTTYTGFFPYLDHFSTTLIATRIR